MSSSESHSAYVGPFRLVDLKADTTRLAAPAFEQHVEFREVCPVARPPTADEAFQNGLVEGEQRGREAALKELLPAIDELRAIATSLKQVHDQRIDAAEADVVQAASDVARHILQGEIQAADDVVLRMARGCLDSARDEGTLVLRVAPDDLELVRTHLPELEHDLAEQTLTLAADPMLARGGVVLETPTRCFEGRPERVLDRIEAVIASGEDPT